jgi:hypothetical protein
VATNAPTTATTSNLRWFFIWFSFSRGEPVAASKDKRREL